MRKGLKAFYMMIAAGMGMIFLYLAMQSIFTDVRIDQREAKYFISTNPLVLFLLLIICGLFFWFHKYVKLSDRMARRGICLFCAIYFLTVITSQNVPRSDQGRILEDAAQILEGNYEAFLPGNYLDINPHQFGIVFIAYLLCLFGGENNYLLIQIFNAAALSGMLIAIYHFGRKYDPQIRWDGIIFGIGIFFPLTLYVNFVYGTIIGLAFSVLALLQQQIYFRERSCKNAVFSALYIAAACVFKSNYDIFLIGILVAYLVDFAAGKKKTLAAIIMTLACYVLLGAGVDRGMSLITEGASDRVEGTPKVTWIVMGLSESSDGWYNGYNNSIYEQNNADAEVVKQISLRDLQEEVKEKTENPGDAIKFFQRKITSMWCEAPFESLYNNRLDGNSVLKGHSIFYDDVISYTGKSNRILLLFLEAFQVFVYLGAALFLICAGKQKDCRDLTGIIIFGGGFAFHLFWEAKSSYALPYFVLLISYAFVGWGRLCDILYSRMAEKGTMGKKFSVLALTAGAFCLICWGGFLLSITEDDESWEQYLVEHRYVEERYYYLRIRGEDEAVGKFYLQSDLSDTWQYEFQEPEQGTRLTSDGEQVYMTDDENYESDAWWHWRIERLNGGYCIRWWNDMNKVLTYDRESRKIYLGNYEENNMDQIWELAIWSE